MPAGNEVPNKNINKSNAQHAIVFEAIALALAIDAGTELLSAGVRRPDPFQVAPSVFYLVSCLHPLLRL